MTLNNTPVTSWYNGKSIFLTGGTGFMGKVLIEKLLYSCSGIKTIYVLIRPKRGKSAIERINDMWKLPVFERLRTSQPNASSKVIGLIGDLNQAQLGLSSTDLETLIKNVNVVFHVGATLKLEATLQDAVEQNTAGTARVLDVAKKIQNLDIFIHFSTAFCSADIDVFEEKVYECPHNPRDVMEVTKWMNAKSIEKVTASLIAPHPNTYTFTKRLAENLVADEADNLPVCIIRPAIVIPSMREPLPGWVDSLNGPMGLLVGAGKGVIRSMHLKVENPAHLIPVDYAISAAIVAAQKWGANKEKPKEVPVYNLTPYDAMPIKMGDLLEVGTQKVRENPFEMQIWYPDGDVRASRWIHLLYCFFLHWIPAYIIDFLLFVFRQKTFMVRLAWKIHNGLELLEFFAVRPFIFKSANFLKLYADLSPEDKEIFNMDCTNVDVESYLVTCILGARQYLMKEDLSSLPRCRSRQKLLYVIHILFVYSFYFFILWMIISSSTTLKNALDYLGRQIPLFN